MVAYLVMIASPTSVESLFRSVNKMEQATIQHLKTTKTTTASKKAIWNRFGKRAPYFDQDD